MRVFLGYLIKHDVFLLEQRLNIFPDCTLLLETLCDLARGIMEACENRSIEWEAMFEGGRGVNQLVDT